MMTVQAVAALAMASGLLVGDGTPEDVARKEQQRIQGGWVAVSEEFEGEKSTEGVSVKVIVRGNKITFSPGKEFTFKLNPTKTPKEMVLTPLEGEDKGQSKRGLYSLDDGLLRLCFNDDVKNQPPSRLKTHQGDGVRVLVLKREKP